MMISGCAGAAKATSAPDTPTGGVGGSSGAPPTTADAEPQQAGPDGPLAPSADAAPATTPPEADAGAAGPASADTASLPDAAAVEAGMAPPPGGSRVCKGLPTGVAAPYQPTYRIALRVHRTRSDLTDDQLCAVLEEINRVWWTQAGVCFEIHAVKDATPMTTGLDQFFERSTPFPNGVTANGVYSGPHTIYVKDKPSLAPAAHPSMTAAGRSGAHELGHALGLMHQNPDQEMNCTGRGTQCDDLLMRSGHNGYQVTNGPPANVNEQMVARQRAAKLALPDTTLIQCAPPELD